MAENIHYGVDNPHPLFNRKTELVWDGKYDEYGRRRDVDIAGAAMPLQKIETIDEPLSRATAQGELDLFNKERTRIHEKAGHYGEKPSGSNGDFRNRLIWGDNKLVMASLLTEFKGKIDLIYIDPPFDVGADFTMDVPIGDEKETVAKDQSTLEMVAYRDMWGKGTDSYLHMMYERLALMKELLSEKGSIYVHCDWRMTGNIRLLLDEMFGGQQLQNEVVWCYRGMAVSQSHYVRRHDTIFFYTKGDHYAFNWSEIAEPLEQSTIRKYKYRDSKNRSFRLHGRNIQGSPIQNHTDIELKWLTSHPELCRVDYLDEKLGSKPRDWFVMDYINVMSDERVDYPTQKPSAILERIIKASSNEGDLIADFFCGSGTTGAVAERLGRRWIMSDLGRFSIHTSRKRLIELQRSLHAEGKPYRAFDVYNLGRYERQWWQKERLHGADDEHRKVVLGFYRAEALPSPTAHLHGRKGRALVYVDGIDSILTREELEQVVKAARETGADEIHCLAWEFEMDLRLICHALEANEGVRIKLIPIPREIMEKNRTSPPPFLEVAVLEAEPIIRGTTGANATTQVDMKLTRFLPSLAEVPSKELEALKERAIKSGFDFIDFWAVDFDWHEGKPFEHHWQDYRTRKDRSLKTVSDFGYNRYPKPGKYTACVKVVDVFGCDTSITVEVRI